MILDEIVVHKRAEVDAAKLERPLAELVEKISYIKPPRDFRAALREDGISLIAEIKRKSPSKGVMLPKVEAVELGALYELAGARAISVLTDKKFFDGTLEDLTTVRRTVHCPCLRK